MSALSASKSEHSYGRVMNFDTFMLCILSITSVSSFVNIMFFIFFMVFVTSKAKQFDI